MSFLWAYILFMIELLIISWVDIRKAKISNYWPVINLALCIVFYLIPGGEYVWSWEILIFPIGLIIVGFLLFLINIMGAGDSKFLASLFLVIPLKYHQVFFERIVITTLVIGFVSLTINILKEKQNIRSLALNNNWKDAFQAMQSRFSYAPVIFIAWLTLGIFLWK